MTICPSSFCSIGGTFCVVAAEGSDCGICSITGGGCDGTLIQECPDANDVCEFDVPQLCPPSNPGTCEHDPCALNTIEGGCVDGFIQIGDDYSLSNLSYLRLTQFRFRGGITNQGEDIIFEIWDETGTILVDTLQVELQVGGIDAPTENLPLTGTRDWTIEIDCWPNCNPSQLEVPQPNPVIIPPRGYVVMRSVRTIGTLNGATAFWSQTASPPDEGTNDTLKMWINGGPVIITEVTCTSDADCPGISCLDTATPCTTDANCPGKSLCVDEFCEGFCEGTDNVLIFALVGVKVPDPFGACCDQVGGFCNNTLRWEGGQGTIEGLCVGGANEGSRGER